MAGPVVRRRIGRTKGLPLVRRGSSRFARGRIGAAHVRGIEEAAGRRHIAREHLARLRVEVLIVGPIVRECQHERVAALATRAAHSVAKMRSIRPD